MHTPKKHTIASSCACETAPHQTRGERIAVACITFILIAAAYQLLQRTNLIAFASSNEAALGLASVFLIGLTASTSSCLAMVGGLLLSVSAQWSSTHPKLGHFAKLEPLLHFNIGRVAGYFLFGGLTGLLGQGLILSLKTTGFIKIALALVMIVLGLNILKIIPKKYCRIPLPAFLMRRIHNLSTSDSIIAPAVLGALTYFVPCGFTQSMQLLALGSGNFWSGAAIMTVFALGTLPALLGISVASSYAGGKVGNALYTFAGTLSLFLGLLNISSGLALAGINTADVFPQFASAHVAMDPNVTIDANGKQIISVGITDSGYSTNAFTVQAGTETWIYARAARPLSGCIAQMAVPDFNIQQSIGVGDNWLGPFTPTKNFQFMCSMGMFRASVNVKS